jgi:hypothetical protein
METSDLSIISKTIWLWKQVIYPLLAKQCFIGPNDLLENYNIISECKLLEEWYIF